MRLLRKILGYRLLLSPVAEGRRKRRQRLTRILAHANRTTPFYKGRFDTFLDAAKSFSDEEFFYAFSHLPIVTKSDLQTRNVEFMSDALQNKPDLFKAGQIPAPGEALKRILKRDFRASISTGGTSGKPSFRWLDYRDANLFAQSFLDSFILNGWKRGQNFVVFYPLNSYFTQAYATHTQTLNTLFGFTMVPFETITRDKVIELLETLRRRKATLLVIFPCVLQRVAEIMHREHIPPFEDLPCINVSGEFFLDCSKKFIQTMFPDSDIQSTYGAVEFGEIAHQSERSSFDYDVLTKYAYLEPGPQNSMLVTSYLQKAFPLIRYRIEDMGQIINDKNERQKLINLEGKNTDFIVGADGARYYASFFNNFINELNRDLGGNPIIHFMLRHEERNGKKILHLNFVLREDSKKHEISDITLQTLGALFTNYDIDVYVHNYFEHDYTRKFKIIGEGDGLAEVVGGYYKQASGL